ncbi:MAG: TraA family conjugative transfer protein [Sulfuricaulis sp.]
MKMLQKSKNLIARYGLLVATLMVLAGTATAGTGGTTFDTIYTTVRGWAEGTLGKLLAVSAFIIGMGIGIVRQSVLAIVLGLAFAVSLAYAPAVIDSIFTFAL